MNSRIVNSIFCFTFILSNKNNQQMKNFNHNLTGKLVELYGDEGLWFKVESDNDDRVEVVCVSTNLPLPPREIVSKRFILQVK